ncbi:hypothetical protein AB7340_21030 [Providencia alcalifaciens]|uniref:hypothetical protein n=1 Tax=unclassified Providencia TaxID=2633465 RepID=UPI00234A3115|nr:MULTISPECIES: hypothetical protein [unclassified Providencia]
MALVAVTPVYVNAQCWVVTNLNGYSAFEQSDYLYEKNGMAKSVFQININKDKAELKMVNNELGGGGLEYMPISTSSMIGFYVNGDTSTIETWSITDQNKVLYSKVVNNHKLVTGTTSLVGDVVGTCSSD